MGTILIYIYSDVKAAVPGEVAFGHMLNLLTQNIKGASQSAFSLS